MNQENQITVGVINLAETEKVTMRIPNDAPVADIRDAIVDAMDLPSRGQDGRRIRYRLATRNEDGRLEQLNEKDTLEAAKVGNGDVLQVLVEMSVGGWHSTDFEGEKSIDEGVFHSNVLQLVLKKVTNLEERMLTMEGYEGSLQQLWQATENHGRSLSDLNESVKTYESPLVEITQKVDSLHLVIQEMRDHLQDYGMYTVRNNQNPTPESETDENIFKDLRMQITYLDFDITFSSIPDEVNLFEAICAWSDGQQQLNGRHRFKMPLTVEELTFDYLLNMGLTKRSAKDPAKLAQELGGKLYNAVFNGEIRECFARCQDFTCQIK
jgi:uncharacterized ubiquitin-like protein YukD